MTNIVLGGYAQQIFHFWDSASAHKPSNPAKSSSLLLRPKLSTWGLYVKNEPEISQTTGKLWLWVSFPVRPIIERLHGYFRQMETTVYFGLLSFFRLNFCLVALHPAVLSILSGKGDGKGAGKLMWFATLLDTLQDKKAVESGVICARGNVLKNSPCSKPTGFKNTWDVFIPYWFLSC